LIHVFNPRGLDNKKKESLFSAIYIGSILILLALILIIHLPISLFDRVMDFFTSLTLAQVPGTSVFLPAPINPAAHRELYGAIFQFAIGIGIIEILVLVLRVVLGSPISRKAETVENIVFWLGAGYLVNTYLMNMTLPTEWFVFWAGIVMIFGLSLIARAFVLLAKR
jgi:hypothetical protein